MRATSPRLAAGLVPGDTDWDVLRKTPLPRAFARGLLLVLPLALGSCTSPIAPTTYASFSQTDLRVGTGTTAARGDLLSVHYTGWLYDTTRPDQKGASFDSSLGSVPFAFILGDGQVIEGWDRGLVGMNVGGLRRLVIPPSLAYEEQRRGSIPPYATLLFEVELLEVE
jgi:FKBP-type peptidyl-prolyl cis-trans isomerase FkpA